MRVWCWLGLGGFAFLPAIALGSNDKALTVHDCINEALGKSPRLEADHYNLQAENEAIKKARAGLLPNITGSAELQNLTGSPTGPFAVLGVNNPDVTGVISFRVNSKTAGSGRVDWATVGNGSLQMRYPLYQNGSILGLNNAPAVAAAKGAYVRQQGALRLSEQAGIEK